MIPYVNILGNEYSIFWYQKEIPSCDDEWGQCQKDERIISIRIHRDPVFTLDTLLHEIMHAIWYEYQMNEDGEAEEAVVGKLSSGMVKVLAANPELVKFIKRSLHG